MPKPKEDETKKKWMERCMSDEEAISDFPEQDQRAAFCNSRWEQHMEDETKSQGVKVKAVLDGDQWTLEVLGNPYGSPLEKDSDGEYFSRKTKFHADKFGLPPVVYYHGFGPNGQPQGEPEFIGKAVDREERTDGVWYRVVLDKSKEFAKRVWEAAKEKVGGAVASSGSLPQLVRVAKDGQILHWPVAELSLWDYAENREPSNRYAVALPQMKTIYKAAGLDLPEGDAERGDTTAEPEEKENGRKKDKSQSKKQGAIKMDEKERQRLIEETKREERERIKAEQEAERKRQEELEDAKEEAVEAYKAELEAEREEEEEKREKEAAKRRRLPDGEHETPYVTKYSALSKYDSLSVEDQAVLVGVLNAQDGHTEVKMNRASEDAVRALAIKLQEAKESNDESTRRVGIVGDRAFKAQLQDAGENPAMKSDEIMQQSLSSYGDEWVGVAYSQSIWEKIRTGTFVADNLPSFEMPPGRESMTIPLESGDPTFYKVAEAADTGSSGWPNSTITSSQMGTGSQSISLSKIGARVLWSGEMEEDSLIPFVSQLRQQLEVAGAEQLEHAIIDGDTATGGSTNINDIAGTPASSDLFLSFDGFRKLSLVTNTANSRDGGSLTVEDYLETMKLMGTAGQNARDKSKIAFIPDPNTYWKSFELEEVKTKDVRAQPVLEDGELVSLYGVPVKPSWFMHYKDSDRLANSSGKVDQDTVSNNSTGALLCVRWDQWLLGYRRRMTMETTRIARADTTEIVALMRLGLVERDNEASAISYNLTV